MIAQTIQLALAPVFVLVAMGNILGILTARLARIVDRSRVLQDRHGETSGLDRELVVAEMRLLDQRIAIINQAIATLVLGGLSIGATVAILFLEELVAFDLHRVAAGTFLLAVALLMAALLAFLRETRLAAASLRIPRSRVEP